MYKTNKDLRESLLIGMVQAMIAKLNGHPNPEYSALVMNFFICMDAKSRKAHDFAAANLFGTTLRTLQRRNAKRRGSNIIQCNVRYVRERVGATLDKLFCENGNDQSFSLAFDGTKTPQKLQLSMDYKAIVGGIYPNHVLDITDKTTEEVKALMADNSDIVRAKEVKACVLTLHGAPPRMSPMSTVAFRPQPLNHSSDYNQVMTDTCSQLCKERNVTSEKGKAHLVSVAADGVGCDTDFIRNTLIEFLRGNTEHVGLVDPLHNAKNCRYLAIVGGSCVVWMGMHVIDPGLFIVAGVKKELWRVKDWASDQVVTALASPNTVTRLAGLRGSEDMGTISVMCSTLFFLRLRLYAVNGHGIPARERITYIWVSMIFLTSFSSKSVIGTDQKNMTSNRRNVITETIGLVFACACSDVANLRYTTTEPCEHTFGAARSDTREFTVLQLIQMEEKKKNFVNAVCESTLQTTRNPQHGYQASFKSFLGNRRKQTRDKGGPVKLKFGAGEQPVVTQLWEAVKLLINSQVPEMLNLLSVFGVSKEQRSPFLREFCTPEELLQLYLDELPTKDKEDEKKGVDGGTHDSEEGMEGKTSDADKNTRNDCNVETLAEAIKLATETSTEATHTESIAESKSSASKDHEDSDSVQVSKAFQEVMQSESLNDVISACKGAMNSLVMKQRESGSTGSEQKCKSLQGRWMETESTTKEVDSHADKSQGHCSERNWLITVDVGKKNNKKECYFRVLGQYTKTYNKWYPDDTNQTWTKSIGKGKFRVVARMVQLDHAFNRYKDVSSQNSQWSPEFIYILCDAKDITGVHGVLRRDI